MIRKAATWISETVQAALFLAAVLFVLLVLWAANGFKTDGEDSHD